MNAAPTKERLLELFEVDLEGGRLFWKVRRSPQAPAGKEAGHAWTVRQKRGQPTIYWAIKVDGRHCRRSQLIYCIATGKWPLLIVDHIDGNSLNDTPANLREATHTQNAWNMHRRMRRVLPMGVYRNDSKAERYCATIRCNRVTYRLGTFSSPDEASNAYQAKRKELFGEFA